MLGWPSLTWSPSPFTQTWGGGLWPTLQTSKLRLWKGRPLCQGVGGRELRSQRQEAIASQGQVMVPELEELALPLPGGWVSYSRLSASVSPVWFGPGPGAQESVSLGLVTQWWNTAHLSWFWWLSPQSTPYPKEIRDTCVMGPPLFQRQEILCFGVWSPNPSQV